MNLPDYFEKANEDELNPIRILHNGRRYKYYCKVTYTDLYQAYLSPWDFKNSGRLEFNFDVQLKQFVLESNFGKFSQHGNNTLITFSTIEDHHTIHDWFICKDWVPLTVLHEENNTIQVDKWLRISKRWISDAN